MNQMKVDEEECLASFGIFMHDMGVPDFIVERFSSHGAVIIKLLSGASISIRFTMDNLLLYPTQGRSETRERASCPSLTCPTPGENGFRKTSSGG